MTEANPDAQLTRLLSEKNFVGAHLYIRRADVDVAEREELIGRLAASIVDELSQTRRENRERLVYLRGVLAWVLREVPGLAPLYREQLQLSMGRTDLFGELAKGVRNLGDVAAGRKSFQEGVQEASDGFRRNAEDAGERMRSDPNGARMTEFFSSAERGIREGLDQFSEMLRGMNERNEGTSSSEDSSRDERAASRADADGDVEDADFQVDDEAEDIKVERD